MLNYYNVLSKKPLVCPSGVLSAPLVEIVFLFSEHTKTKIARLNKEPTCRYRDNFFWMSKSACSAAELALLEEELTAFYSMPIKYEGKGHTWRCLELLFTADSPVKCLISLCTKIGRVNRAM